MRLISVCGTAAFLAAASAYGNNQHIGHHNYTQEIGHRQLYTSEMATSPRTLYEQEVSVDSVTSGCTCTCTCDLATICAPTSQPTSLPTSPLSPAPTASPTESPTASAAIPQTLPPTEFPTSFPTRVVPTPPPSAFPTLQPSTTASANPTILPTSVETTAFPSLAPTNQILNVSPLPTRRGRRSPSPTTSSPTQPPQVGVLDSPTLPPNNVANVTCPPTPCPTPCPVTWTYGTNPWTYSPTVNTTIIANTTVLPSPSEFPTWTPTP